MPERINLNLLHTLLILLEERHVSRCAARLHLTQSAVSRQLAQLRDHFQDPLFVRNGNQLVTTPKADTLHQQLNTLFNDVGKIVEQTQFIPARWQGECVFSSSDYVAQYIFPDIVSAIRKQAPEGRFSYTLWHQEYLDKLGDKQIQLASTMLQEAPTHLSSALIGEDKAVCVMHERHPLAHLDNLSLENFLHYPHIRISGGGDKDSFVDRHLQGLQRSRHIAATVPFFSSAFTLLAHEQYLLTIPHHIAHNLKSTCQLTFKPMPFEVPTHRYWLLWHPKYEHDPAHVWLREQALSIMRDSMYSVSCRSSV
ncbi:LysR family transcriptional regulator [Thaumasiovibrio subtropicus]|uniref:LysR family transcriptional regulator n=1 Tax=Thaumasiovibrio subtropicus TaxID=1891207 RepID=UPI000B34D19C|nr:LysR family transcriptional regulator [Thaumasiovibrio subtropicus]